MEIFYVKFDTKIISKIRFLSFLLCFGLYLYHTIKRNTLDVQGCES